MLTYTPCTLLLLAVLVPTRADPCADEHFSGLPFCNASLSFESRAADLVERIPLDQQLGLLSTTSDGVAALDIGPFQWWSEGLHGVRCGHGIDCKINQTTTIFPQPIGPAASFNRTLWHATGSAISTEFRAFSNVGRGFLSIFAPNINILRGREIIDPQ
jgi:beta-D-xylosidase 4